MPDVDSVVADAGSKARDQWYGDGLYTLGYSALFLLLGSATLIPLPVRPFWWEHWAVFVPLLVLVYLVLREQSPVMNWLKARITYPRTGYVLPEPEQLKRDDWKRYPEGLVVVFSGIWFGLYPAPWIGLILLAGGLGFLWGRFGFSLFIPTIALTGIVVAALPMPAGHPVAYMAIVLGIFYFIKGAAQLVRYLHHHPTAHLEGEGSRV